LLLMLVAGGVIAIVSADRTTSRPAGVDATRTPKTSKGQTPARTHRAHQTKPQRSAVQTLGAPTRRTFGWASVPHASAYEVRFFRGRQVIFAARPLVPRIVLPAAWRYHGHLLKLTSGRYTWTVRPLFGSRTHPRYGNFIVRATFALGPKAH
jgi:hypothetical protein